MYITLTVAHDDQENSNVVQVWAIMNGIDIKRYPSGNDGGEGFHLSGHVDADHLLRCCQSNGNSSPSRRSSPKPKRGLGHDCAPLGQGGRASLLVEFAADEMAFQIKMVGDRSVDRGEFLECLHPPEPEHGPLSSSERLV